jgi:hypothetical protein
MRAAIAIAVLALTAGILLLRDPDTRPEPPPEAAQPPAEQEPAPPPPQAAAPQPQPPQPELGRINFIRNATSSFDPFLEGTRPAERRWIASTYWRIRAYHPFFAKAGALAWAPPAHFYKDLYALYRDEPEYRQILEERPEWVLRDAQGAPLYIPADCNGESCTQYAADIGNRDFRSWWISRARSTLAKGYAGIFVDDVNMEMRVSDGAAESVAPVDPRTGRPMKPADWRRYVAVFTEEIDAALPEAEIVHNAHWWVGHDDPFVRRQIAAADLIELERGYNDAGLTGGGGTFGLKTFMAHIDWLHTRGKSVILEPYDLDPARQEYELAGYYLTRAGSDAIASDFEADPGNWSPAWKTDLGTPLASRYAWNGLWRRNYARGIVLVNQPGRAPRTFRVRRFLRLSGQPATSVTLGPAEGVVLLRAG